ncbi:MAG: H-NS histone family protein [Burkholderia sp.]|jgi:DNA-binding protein H-NS|uniref:H-NS histone family protein n=1 Tax=Burkholderia sp. TaxID=36773 RepID=UPI00283496CF|nr:H-NS histone family protein [Burkholderia sp.]MDR0240436.1 H-NS histone family protein [Burkholderia sp.]
MEGYRSYKERLIELRREIELERRKVAGNVLEEVRACIQEFGFTPAQVFSIGPKGRRVRKARYFDPLTGASWTGNGREPAWIRGMDRSKFELPLVPDE